MQSHRYADLYPILLVTATTGTDDDWFGKERREFFEAREQEVGNDEAGHR